MLSTIHLDQVLGVVLGGIAKFSTGVLEVPVGAGIARDSVVDSVAHVGLNGALHEMHAVAVGSAKWREFGRFGARRPPNPAWNEPMRRHTTSKP